MAEAAVGLGAAMATALGAIVVTTIEMADKMGKLAQTTGFTTEKLSALSYAAKMADIDQESLGKGLEKLAKNMDAAAQSQAPSAFGRLGISVKDASGHLKESDVVLGQIAEKFSKMPNGAQKTALAMEIFGKAGAQLIPLLNEGKDGLEELRAEAERLGLVIDGQTAQAAQKFQDDLKRMKMAAEGAALQLTAGLLPALNQIVDAFSRATGGANGFKDIGESLGKVAKGIALGFMSAAFALDILINKIMANKSQLVSLIPGGVKGYQNSIDAANQSSQGTAAQLVKQISDFMEKLDSSSSGSSSGIKKTTGNLVDMAAAATKAAEELKKFQGQLQSLADTVSKQDNNPYAKAFAEAAIEERKLMELIGEQPAWARQNQLQVSQIRAGIHKNLLDELAKLDNEYQTKLMTELTKIGEAEKNAALAGALALTPGPNVKNGNANPFQVATDNLSKDKKQQAADAVQLFDQTRTASERYSQQLNKLNILLQSGAINQTVYNRAVVQARLTMTPMGQVVQGVGDAFGTMFESVVTGTKSMGEAFASMAQSIVASIAQMIAKMLVLWAVQKLLGFFFGGLGTASNSGNGANLNSLSSAGIGNTNFGFGTGSIAGHRAGGGSVFAGRAYMVGEMGPEPFIPATNGTILPHGTGGGGGNIYIDATGADAGVEQRIMRAMAKAMETTKASTLAAVRDRRLRGATI